MASLLDELGKASGVLRGGVRELLLLWRPAAAAVLLGCRAELVVCPFPIPQRSMAKRASGSRWCQSARCARLLLCKCLGRCVLPTARPHTLNKTEAVRSPLPFPLPIPFLLFFVRVLLLVRLLVETPPPPAIYTRPQASTVLSTRLSRLCSPYPEFCRVRVPSPNPNHHHQARKDRQTYRSPASHCKTKEGQQHTTLLD